MASERRVRPTLGDLLARANPADVERISKAMMASIDEVSGARWEAALERAANLPGDLRPEKIQSLTRSFAREMALVGAGAGAAAATPLVGTTATVLAATAELAWFTARAGDLILTIAALHGRPTPTVDERRAWVLAVLIFGGSAKDGFVQAINQAGTGGLTPAATSRLPVATLQRVNGLMSRMLLRRYGARRGAVALGTALPLGVGAIVGGSANYTAIRKLAKNAEAFFSHMPYSAIDTTAIDITGRLGS